MTSVKKPKSYKNYLKNKALRRNDWSVRQIVKGQPTKHWGGNVGEIKPPATKPVFPEGMSVTE
jgi:hypothetical protein